MEKTRRATEKARAPIVIAERRLLRQMLRQAMVKYIVDKYGEDKLQFLLVGPAAKIQDQVKKYAPRMKVQSIKEPGLRVPAF